MISLWRVEGFAEPNDRFPGDENVIGVVYSRVPAPYQSIFDSIISGIKQGSQYSVNVHSIADDQDWGDVGRQYSEGAGGLVIVLGSKGFRICDYARSDINILAGAIIGPPGKNENCRLLGGVTLTPSPKEVLERLASLSEKVDQVYTVYNPTINEWIMEYAVPAAKAQGIRLHSVPAGDLQEAVGEYRKLVSAGIGERDAVWLLQDSYTVDNSTILPLLLKASWEQEFILFSNNPAHVKRGALFSLYPDYRAMGVRLGRLAANRIQDPAVKNPEMSPLRDVLIAVNLRTANHLGLDLSNRQIEEFDLTFPASR